MNSWRSRAEAFATSASTTRGKRREAKQAGESRSGAEPPAGCRTCDIERHRLELAGGDRARRPRQLIDARADRSPSSPSGGQRRELERRADNRGQRAERSADELRQIVAGDVLTTCPPAFDNAPSVVASWMPITRSRGVPNRWRCGPLSLVASSPPIVARSGERRIERQPLAVRRELLVQVVQPDAGLDRRREIAGLVREHAVQPRHVDQDVDRARAGAPRHLRAAARGSPTDSRSLAGPLRAWPPPPGGLRRRRSRPARHRRRCRARDRRRGCRAAWPEAIRSAGIDHQKRSPSPSRSTGWARYGPAPRRTAAGSGRPCRDCRGPADRRRRAPAASAPGRRR